jgi:hypothetical protein
MHAFSNTLRNLCSWTDTPRSPHFVSCSEKQFIYPYTRSQPGHRLSHIISFRYEMEPPLQVWLKHQTRPQRHSLSSLRHTNPQSNEMDNTSILPVHHPMFLCTQKQILPSTRRTHRLCSFTNAFHNTAHIAKKFESAPCSLLLYMITFCLLLDA